YPSGARGALIRGNPEPMFASRYGRIVFFFAGAVSELLLWDWLMPRLGLRALSRRTGPGRLRRIAARFRALAIGMGGVLIKVGQFLSARLDVLPEEITSELAGLQDEVPPEDPGAVRRETESELGDTLERKFIAFDETPLAAASLGQAHRARLAGDPAEVVVKVQRPHIEDLIATDLAALRTVGGWMNRFPPIRERADVPALLAEFTRVLQGEVDYLAEGRNAERLAEQFRGRPEIRIPRVVWSHTTRRVLTLEDVYAIKITDYAAITAAGVDRADVARRLFDAYLQQIFRDGFFHADPHPGNLFVAPGPGPAWRLVFVDFGMVGHVPPAARAGLREAAIAIGTRDSARLVRAFQSVGILLPHADLALLERAVGRVFEHLWGRSMSELRRMGPRELSAFGNEFRELLYDLPFQIPQDLILLGRTFGILSGMCTGLDPDFNAWVRLEPFARELIAEEAAGGLKPWLERLEGTVRALLAVPGRMDSILTRMERGEIAVRVPDVSAALARLEVTLRRLLGAVVFAALLLGGAQLLLSGHSLLGGALLAGAGVTLLWMILAPRPGR
ncbi:MAG TPA: AarF/UbiB family protein, partial [Candidatus Eisenbacteria bacterium]